MAAATHPAVVRSCEAGARALGQGVAGAGALIALAWSVHVPALDHHLYGGTILPRDAALGFALVGAALSLGTRPEAWARRISAGLGALASLLGALEWAAGGGRVEPESALAFVVLGAAVVAAHRGDRAVACSQGAALALALGAVAVLFTRAYSAKFAFGVAARLTTTVTGALAFLGAAVSLLLMRPARGLMSTCAADTSAGFLARRLYPAAFTIPIVLGGLVLLAEERRLFNGKFGLTLLVLLCAVALVTLIALTNRAFARMEAARARLAAVLLAENERRALARDLHDAIGQSLTALKTRLEIVNRDTPTESAAAAARLCAQVMEQVSSLSLELRPAALDDLGLVPALVALSRQWHDDARLDVHLQHDCGAERLPPHVETAAYRIVQEAVSNAGRHSTTTAVQVRAYRQGAWLHVQVDDQGCGFDPQGVPRSAGLLGMRERAEAVGGHLEIDAAPGRGTRIAAELPLGAR